MTEKKDSLDIMLEMNTEVLWRHPVIIEVLNLVYEGKYSVDSSVLSLSQTLTSFFVMEMGDLKSIQDRLIYYIKSFGETGGSKQASLQFNIWKQCIEQREQDEMLFTVIISSIILAVCAYLDINVGLCIDHMVAVFGTHFFDSK